jgi:hypothetical protein
VLGIWPSTTLFAREKDRLLADRLDMAVVQGCGEFGQSLCERFSSSVKYMVLKLRARVSDR